jgi:PTS system N-acetylgalactosamine-specific IIB component
VILLLRVDNRLVHGQILEAWVPKLAAREVLVADDEAAASPLARAALTLCVPPDLPVRIEPLDSVKWADLAASKTPTLVVVRDLEAVVRAKAGGLAPAMTPAVNLGNIHFAPDRKSITASLFLSGAEIGLLRALEREGFRVEARPVPAEPPMGLDEIERRHAAASR